MFVTLSRLFTFFILPSNQIFLFLLAGILLFKRPKLRLKLFTAGFLWLCLFGNQAIYDWAIKSWQVPQAKIQELPAQKLAILLGGGGLAPTSSLDDIIQNTSSRSRFNVPVSLFNAGKFERMIITAGSFQEWKGLEAEHLEQYYKAQRIPEERLILDREAVNTFQNALQSKRLLREANHLDEPVILITDAFHMRRALATFEKQGIDCIPYASGYQGEENEHTTFIDYILPSFEVVAKWNLLFKEIVGYTVYKLTGRL